MADIEALGEERGPLIISGEGGKTFISVFTRDNLQPNIFPAFEVAVEQFIMLYEKLDKPRVFDHKTFISFYFFDFEGNSLEFCSKSYDEMKKVLTENKIEMFPMNAETYAPYLKQKRK